MSRISSSNHAYERVGGSRWVFSLNSRVNIYLQPEPVFSLNSSLNKYVFSLNRSLNIYEQPEPVS